MQLKETTNILDGFTDIEESFKTELEYLGINTSILIKELFIRSSDLGYKFSLISSNVFKIYISTKDLKGLLSVDPTENKKSNGIYLTNFHELECCIIHTLAHLQYIKESWFFNSIVEEADKSEVVKAKEVLINSISSLEYFLDKFKELHEDLKGVDL